MNLKPSAAFVVLVSTLIPVAGAEHSDIDLILSFEGSRAGAIPPGWGGGPAEKLFADDKVVHRGSWAGRLERSAESPEAFSTFLASIPAPRFPRASRCVPISPGSHDRRHGQSRCIRLVGSSAGAGAEADSAALSRKDRGPRRRNIDQPGRVHGIGIFYPDGKPAQRVGIVPDVEARPSIAGLHEGRDEVLEVAFRQIVGPDVPETKIREIAKP